MLSPEVTLCRHIYSGPVCVHTVIDLGPILRKSRNFSDASWVPYHNESVSRHETLPLF